MALLQWAFPGLCALALASLACRPLLRSVDLQVLSQWQHVRAGPRRPCKVALVEIDKASVDHLGWPVNRQELADLVRLLDEADARAIVFNLILKADSSGGPSGDADLVSAARAAARVHLAYSFGPSSEDSAPPEPVPVADLPKFALDWRRGDEGLPLTEARSVELPHAQFCAAAAGLGHTHYGPAADGRCRTVTLLVPYRGRLYPSLALLAATQALGPRPSAVLRASERCLVTDAGSFPTTSCCEAMLSFPPDWRRRFGTVSLGYVLGPGSPAQRFEGKIVVVGVTAPAAAKLVLTPVGPMPGPAVTATAIDNILNNELVRRPSPAVPAILALLAAYAVYAGARRREPLTGWLVLANAALLLHVAAALSYVRLRTWLPVTAPTLAAVTVQIVYSGIRLRSVRQILRWTFGERILGEIELEPTQARTVTASVAFLDIGGYSEVSTRHTADDIVEIIRAFRDAAQWFVAEEGGVITNYAGDSILVVFEADGPSADHARAAVSATLRIAKEVPRTIDEGLDTHLGLVIRGGISTGEVRLGMIPTRERAEYTVIGDAVNVAERLRGLAKEHEALVLISGETYRLLPDADRWTYADTCELRSRTGEVRIYKPTP